MNPQEQKERATAVSQLRADYVKLVEDVTTIIEAEAVARNKSTEVLLRDIIGLVNAESAEIKREYRVTQDMIIDFRQMPLKSRLRWLLIGRL